MHKQQDRQKGGVTILLVVLLGVAAMVATASVAYSINSKKEASVAAHAQTNAQMMAWAGTSAFFDYIKAKGALGIDVFKAMHGTSVTLKSGGQEVIAKNIAITGACTADNDPCTVTADISANNSAAKAANTINVVYEMKVQNGTVVAAVKSKASFGGNLTIDGKISSETPNADVELTVKDGNLTIDPLSSIDNISNLTLNATGNVRISCTAANCGNIDNIDINAGGHIYITDTGYGKFGNLNAKKYIRISGTTAKNLRAIEYVALSTGAHADNIQAGGDVTLDGGAGALRSSAKNIEANGNVIVSWSTAEDVSARGAVEITAGANVNNIVSGKRVWARIAGTKIKGNIYSKDYTHITDSAVVEGDIVAKGDSLVNCITGLAKRTVCLETFAEVKGTIYAKGKVKNVISGTTNGICATDDSCALAQTKVDQMPIFAGVDTQVIADAVDAKFDFNNNVNVTVYKNESNYIFVKVNGVSRVFLNKLKNPANGNIYSYEADGKQYVTIAGAKTLVGDGGGYYIGKYTMGGTQKYVGAICESVSSGVCTSNVLAYIPRVSAEDKPFGNAFESLGYGTPLSVSTWYVRTFFDDSNIDNASIAPGVFYFEGDLKIHGNPNWKADPTSNAYTDTFLAEGDVSAVLSSPKIFSPYNILREKPDASIICNRSYKAADGTTFSSAPTTSPTTIGSKYLVPTNLCKNDTTFAYNMDKVAGTNNKDLVVIDGKDVPKLDLGYVALMSNKNIEVGECAQIFGDVLARGKIYASAGCGVTLEKQAITGNITTQGEGSQPENRILGGSRYVIPSEDHSNIKTTTGSTSTGPVLNPGSIQLKWAKSL